MTPKKILLVVITQGIFESLIYLENRSSGCYTSQSSQLLGSEYTQESILNCG
jgi:hypothetical protein